MTVKANISNVRGQMKIQAFQIALRYFRQKSYYCGGHQMLSNVQGSGGKEAVNV
jgi:hypothetical protein